MEQSLTLNNRADLTITGIKKVRSSEPNAVIANLDGGSIIINGQNLTVENLNIKDGHIHITGTINSVR